MKRDKICSSNKFVSISWTCNFLFAGSINYAKAVGILHLFILKYGYGIPERIKRNGHSRNGPQRPN